MGIRRLYHSADSAAAFDTVITLPVQKGAELLSVAWGAEIAQGAGKYVWVAVYDDDGTTCTTCLPTTVDIAYKCVYYYKHLYITAGAAYYTQLDWGGIFPCRVPLQSGYVTFGMKSDGAAGVGMWWVSLVIDEKTVHDVSARSQKVT